MTRIPDAVQRRCTASGIVANSGFATIPGLQRIISCCAAPGKSVFASGRGESDPYRSGENAAGK
jgi:hypothetical protein